MQKGTRFLLSIILIMMYSGNALADDFEYHPALSDNFNFTVGAFRSNNFFAISAEGTIPGDDSIDFGTSVGVDESSTILNAGLRWNFGKGRKWSLWGQYFSNDATGEAILNEDVEWQDVIFREGTFVGAGVKLEITRALIGRSIVKNQQHDFGIGIGIHNLDLSTYIEGDISIDDETTDFFRSEASNSQPLPNIGAWYNYSPARKWLLQGRVDWISAKIGDYDGTLWNTFIGVNYQAFRHVGFSLAYQLFDLNVTVTSSDWKGDVDLRYRGPVLSVTGNW